MVRLPHGRTAEMWARLRERLTSCTICAHAHAHSSSSVSLDFCPVPSRRLRLRLLAPSHARLRCMLEKAAVVVERVTAAQRIVMQSKDVQNEIVISQLGVSARIAAAETHGAWVNFAQRSGVSVPERLEQLDESARQYYRLVTR